MPFFFLLHVHTHFGHSIITAVLPLRPLIRIHTYQTTHLHIFALWRLGGLLAIQSYLLSLDLFLVSSVSSLIVVSLIPGPLYFGSQYTHRHCTWAQDTALFSATCGQPLSSLGDTFFHTAQGVLIGSLSGYLREARR